MSVLDDGSSCGTCTSCWPWWNTAVWGKPQARSQSLSRRCPKAIADMEYTLGLRLLDRARHGMEPTAYGRALISRGVTVFDELRQAVEELKFLADPTAGAFRVGASLPPPPAVFSPPSAPLSSTTTSS